MSYKQLKFGLLYAAIVGCTVGMPINVVANDGISIREDRLEYPEIKLTKIFGVNDEVLADTNRFPVSSSCWYDIDLPEDMGGFKTVKFTLKDDNGKFGIYYATMTKVLPAEADDRKLLEEFKSAVDMVGKILGVELKCPGLIDVEKWKRHWGMGADMLSLRSNLRVKLADGCEIRIDAADATYVRRDGEWRLVANASVIVRVENANLLRRRLQELESRLGKLEDRLHKRSSESRQIGTVHEVEFGVDLSQQLSEIVKDEAEAHNAKGDGKLGVKRLEKKANSGDVHSMLLLAASYKMGIVVKEDKDLAFKYSKMAADAGDVQGIAELARCYEEGLGTQKDVVKAASLWKKAAEMGEDGAILEYARCLAEGIGVDPNPKKAAELVMTCASRNHVDELVQPQIASAQLQIASFYLRGFGVEKDEAKAREWLDKLEARAEEGDYHTIGILTKFYLDGEKGVGKDAARAYKMAQLAEKTDTPWGYKAIARCYKDGIGVEKNKSKAKEYVEKGLGKCKNGKCNRDDLKKLLKELEGAE